MAAASIANIVKSSLGPVGLDKMLVDDIGVSNTLLVVRGVRLFSSKQLYLNVMRLHLN